METMKLKDVVGLVEKTLSENKFQSVMQSGNPYYLLSYEEKQKWFGNAPPIEWGEIENLNQTFWDCDIKPGMEMTVAAAIAVNLANQCMTEDERKGMLNRIQALRENVSENWLRRLNKRKKFNGEDGICGVFNKFELIQKFGYMYDSEDEGNADANDTTATCPIIIGQLNSGWVNYRAGEKDGKVVVEKRKADLNLTPLMFLIMIGTELEHFSAWKNAKAMRSAINAVFVFDKLKYRSFHSSAPQYGSFDFNTPKSQQELIEAMKLIMMDEDTYPQGVYDFKTLNRDFIQFVASAFMFINQMDETQDDLVRSLLDEIIAKMKELSEVEARIVKEQQMRDDTGRFVKPKFNIDYLVYTYALASVIKTMEMKYHQVNRIVDTTVSRKEYEYHLGNFAYTSYTRYKDCLDRGDESNLEDAINATWIQRLSKMPFGMTTTDLDNITKHRDLYEQWYKQDKDKEDANPFFRLSNKYERYLKYQYTCL